MLDKKNVQKIKQKSVWKPYNIFKILRGKF